MMPEVVFISDLLINRIEAVMLSMFNSGSIANNVYIILFQHYRFKKSPHSENYHYCNAYKQLTLLFPESTNI